MSIFKINKKGKKRIKKRYLLFGIFLSFMTFLHSGCLSFRMSETKQQEELEKNGQFKTPIFKTYTANEKAMHYTHIGEEGLPLLMFLHGSPGSSSAFMNYLSDTNLSAKAQLIAIDRPGSGYSDFGVSEPSFQKQSEMMMPALKDFKASKRILIGHSLGGPLIVRMAMDYPELVDGIIILAGSVAPELEPKEPYRKPMNWKAVRWLIPKSFRVSNQEILTAKEELNKMLPLWKDIKVPVIVLQGDKDILVAKENADFAEKMLVNSPKVDIRIIEKENHFFIWSKKYLVDEAIYDMLKWLEETD